MEKYIIIVELVAKASERLNLRGFVVFFCKSSINLYGELKNLLFLLSLWICVELFLHRILTLAISKSRKHDAHIHSHDQKKNYKNCSEKIFANSVFFIDIIRKTVGFTAAGYMLSITLIESI
jgi:hypothetical protein